jgi:hypothetical protein
MVHCDHILSWWSAERIQASWLGLESTEGLCIIKLEVSEVAGGRNKREGSNPGWGKAGVLSEGRCIQYLISNLFRETSAC